MITTEPYLIASSRDDLIVKLKADCLLVKAFKSKLRFERWQVNKFLLANAQNLKVFPIDITHTSQSNPDFRLRVARHAIGIEASRITNQLLEEQRIRAQGAIDATPYQVENDKSPGELRNLSSLNVQFVQGHTASQQDRYWIRTTLEMIERKTARLNNNAFCHYDETWLFLWDTLSLFKDELACKSRLLYEELVQHWGRPGWFSRVVIESHDLEQFAVIDANECGVIGL